MPIYTPRGLKIRLAVPYAFALMARLHPQVSAFRVLKTTEGLESIPGCLAFVAGLIAFGLRATPFQIGLMAFFANFIGTLINFFGFYVVPGLVPMGTLFSYLSGYGLFSLTTVTLGFWLTGWMGVVAFFLSQVLAWIAGQPLEWILGSKSHKALGHAFTASERNFFNAYRLHASRLDISTNIDLQDDELREDNWRSAFEVLDTKWPEVTARFSD